jgi:hypothetical protein
MEFQPARGTVAGFVFSAVTMLDKALTLTRTELRDYDGAQLAALLAEARKVFRDAAQLHKLSKALKRGEETVRDYLRRLIWSVLAVQAEQKRDCDRLMVSLLNAAGRSRRSRQTVCVPM